MPFSSDPRAARRGFRLTIAGAGLVALSVLALYWPARVNGFVADDWLVVVALAKAATAMSWWETLLRPPAEYAVLFRPLSMLTFLVQIWAGHVAPEPFHLVNAAMHAVNAFLLTLVAWALLKDDGEPGAARTAMLASLSGLVYGLHPALVEPATWISARPDLLLTLLMCLALLSDRLLPGPGWGRPLAVGTCFLASLLTKETALGLIVALPIVHWAIEPRASGIGSAHGSWKVFSSHARVYAALLLALVLYLSIRFLVTGPGMGVANMITPASYIDGPWQRVLVVIATLSHQVWAAIWPFQTLLPSRQLPLPVDASQLLPVAAASSLAIALAFLATRAGGAARTAGWLALAFVAALIPVANIVPIPAVSTPVEIALAPRYLTFPLIFACLAVPFAVSAIGFQARTRAGLRKGLLGVVLVAWVLASAAFVRVTIPLWKDDLTMYAWALRSGAISFWHYGNLGAHYFNSGDLVAARGAFESALKLRDDEHSAWIWLSLGAVETGLGHRERALQAFRRAVELDPGNARAYLHLGMAERDAGDTPGAETDFTRGIRSLTEGQRDDDLEGRLRYELGLLYRDAGRGAEALAQLTASHSLARRQDDREKAERALKSLEAGRPSHPGKPAGGAKAGQ